MVVEHLSHNPLLISLLFYFCLAGVLLPLLERYRINRVIGFIIAGIIFGPQILGSLVTPESFFSHFVFSQNKTFHYMGELGIMFMLFMIGLELSVPRLWKMRGNVFIDGGIQVVTTISVICLVMILFGYSGRESLVLAIALCFSSTAVVLQYLQQKQQLGSELGQRSVAILLFQDLMVIPALILVAVLGAREVSGWGFAIRILEVMGTSLLVLVFLYYVGKGVLNPLFRNLIKSKETDSFFALVLFIFFGVLAICSVLDVSLALGALLVGALLSETEFKHSVAVMIDPFKGLLIGVFFLSIGLSIDLHLLFDEPLLIILVTLLYLLSKAIILLALTKWRIGNFSLSLRLTGLLSSGSEFAFVVIAAAVASSALSLALADIATLVVAITVLCSLPLVSLSETIIKKWEKNNSKDTNNFAPIPHTKELKGHVVICGFGRVGQAVAKFLRKENIPYIALETNAEKIKKLNIQDQNLYYGDPTVPGLIDRMDIDNALAVLLTMDNSASANETLTIIKRKHPHATVYARSRDDLHALVLQEQGANAVIPETLEVSLQFISHVLKRLSFPSSSRDTLMHHFRQEQEVNMGLDTDDD